jgi:2-dehydro-3-deoxyphosphooctonate aldolase (KDO 8-P synthase)
MLADNLYKKIRGDKFIISGPCVLESYEKALKLAKFAQRLVEGFGFTYIFKASFDKANRTSVDSFRGVGLDEGVEIFKELSKDFLITTDVHETHQVDKIAEVVDIIQIPAFLCRQTDLLLSAGETQKVVSVKKFQLLSGQDMIRPLEKIQSTGNDKVILIERGTLVPYGNVILDVRNLIDMKKLGVPVVMDCTHTCQSLNSGQTKTSGRKEMAELYAQVAGICGIKGFFAEIYDEPELAKSDSSTSLNFSEITSLVEKVSKVINLNNDEDEEVYRGGHLG